MEQPRLRRIHTPRAPNQGGIKKIKRAIISVYDKTGLEALVDALEAFKVEIISSGGTFRKINEIGYKNLIRISDYTKHSESPGGLVKTLHPKVHGGLLLNRNNPEHKKWMDENKIKPIDLVVSNLYPFEKAVAEGANLKTAADYIDIGGPTMTRSAAKASLLYDQTCIVTEPAQYVELINTLKQNNGELTTELRRKYALRAFYRTKNYDSAIVSYLEEEL